MIPIHFPVVEFLYFLMKFRNNRPFMRLSRIFMLTLVTLSALSYAGAWVKSWEAGSVACKMGRFICYQGPPLSLPEYIFQLRASLVLFLLPVIDLLDAFLLLFKPARAYFLIFLLSLIGFISPMFAEPHPYVNTMVGTGQWLHFFTSIYLMVVCIPLAMDEQIRLHPDWNYRGFLPWFMLPS